MSDAERAHQEGARTVERDTYRKAAQAFPTSKEPWLKLAESYFEADDYGNAILSAQEVLHRDSADKVATSLLAVSGLRVSATALSSMRQQQDMSADTRRQAEDVVKALREALGEKALVPQVAEAASAPASALASALASAPAPAPKRFFTRRAGSAAVVAAAASSPSMSAAAPVPAAPTTVSKKSANPFDALK